jgi:hypothetical protein
MVPGLQEVYALVAYQIDDAVVLGQPARPGARCEVAQGFGFADTLKRIAQDRLDQLQRPQSQLAVSCHPVAQIFQEFRVEDGLTVFLRQCLSLSVTHLETSDALRS